MLTIVMLTWEYPPALVGGLARHVHALSTELVRQGHRVVVLTSAVNEEPSEREEEGVYVIRVLPYFQRPADFRLGVSHLNFALLEAGVRLFQGLEGRVILHAHDWLAAYAGRGLKHLYKAPLVATVHATEYGRQGGIRDSGQQYINDVEWWLTYEAWRVIVCSKSMRQEVRHLFGLSGDKISVIPNGTAFKTAGEGVSRNAYAAPDERLLFHIGRLVGEKGAAVLLEAVALLRSRHRLRLIIAGVGPFREELVRLTAKLGIGELVTYAGWVEDHVAQGILRVADAAVVPSLYEPFGIVALEAMAAGTPLIASDVGGLAEIVEDGITGLKSPPGDAAALARQIDRLLSDPALARRLGEEGRRHALERYSWSAVARATAEVYQSVSQAAGQMGWGLVAGERPHGKATM